MVLLDTGTHGTSRETYSEDVDDGTRTRNPCLAQKVKHSVYNRGVASSSPIISSLSPLLAKNSQAKSKVRLFLF